MVVVQRRKEVLFDGKEKLFVGSVERAKEARRGLADRQFSER